MSTAGPNGSTKRRTTPDVPYFVVHDSFEQTGAADLFGPTRDDDLAFIATYMPDDVTRDLARRMHYAAWRLSRVADLRRRAHWKAQYLSFRDRIVLGNRKLIYRAVQPLDAGGHMGGRHDGGLSDRLDPSGGGLQSLVGHSLQHLRFYLSHAWRYRGCRNGTRRIDCRSRFRWKRCRTANRATWAARSSLLPICLTLTSSCAKVTPCSPRGKGGAGAPL